MQAIVRATDRGESPVDINCLAKASRSRRLRASTDVSRPLGKSRERGEIAAVALDRISRETTYIAQVGEISVDGGFTVRHAPSPDPLEAQRHRKWNTPPRGTHGMGRHRDLLRGKSRGDRRDEIADAIGRPRDAARGDRGDPQTLGIERRRAGDSIVHHEDRVGTP